MSTVQKIRRGIAEVVRYLWVAGVATVVNVGSGVIYREYFGMNVKWSCAAGYATGTLVGFLLSRSFSFKNRTSRGARSESIKFLFVTFCAFLVTFFVSLGLLQAFNWLFEVSPFFYATAVHFSSLTRQEWINRELVANIGGIGIGFFVNFFGHKFLTFRQTNTLDFIRRRRGQQEGEEAAY